MAKQLKNSKRRTVPAGRLRLLLFAGLIAVTGVVLLAYSDAATPAAFSEAETGTIRQPATKLSDPAASGGQVVRFGPESPATTSPPRSKAITRRAFPITVSGTTQEVGYYSNGAIDMPDANVERVVFVIHGTGRDADEYIKFGYAAATKADAKPETATLVVAPHFVAEQDIRSSDTKLTYWTDQGWKDGDNSRNSPYSRPWRISSFAVIDKMAEQAKASFPKLKSIVVIGHSAGGQFANRYAAGTKLPEQLSGIDFRFAIANPSSYLYFDERRPKDGAFPAFNSSSCSDFNTYKYGLKGANEYIGLTGTANIPAQYKRHKVYYLLGDKDNVDAHSMDSTCPAMAQGPFRLQRGNNYFAYLAAYYGSAPAGHIKLIVPGVDHNGEAMITSTQGIQAVYGQ